MTPFRYERLNSSNTRSVVSSLNTQRDKQESQSMVTESQMWRWRGNGKSENRNKGVLCPRHTPLFWCQNTVSIEHKQQIYWKNDTKLGLHTRDRSHLDGTPISTILALSTFLPRANADRLSSQECKCAVLQIKDREVNTTHCATNTWNQRHEDSIWRVLYNSTYSIRSHDPYWIYTQIMDSYNGEL